MRSFLAIVIILSAAACATVDRQWDKPGVGREVVLLDLSECLRVASAETWRRQLDYGSSRYSHGLLAPVTYGRRDSFFARRHHESDRFADEGRLARFCMRNKGYEWIDSPGDVTPPSPPR